MEKKYTLVEVKETGTTCPFKTYLFETALKEGMTDISDEDSFNRNIEIYKRLKENDYLGKDTVIVDVPGYSGKLTKNEAHLAAMEYENKVDDIKSVLERVKKMIEEKDKEPKIVVYTCITGGYDNILEPSVITEGVDYVCFTDNPNMKSKTWRMMPIPEELNALSDVKKQRGIKILAHRYLPDYDISVWVDGAVVVRGNIKSFLKLLELDRYSVFIPEHPVRKCIYKEKDACIVAKKIKGDGIALAEKQMKRYREEGFPENYGLVQTNVMIRRHNEPYCKNLMEKWWSELKDNSHRDQLSFNYALWKVGDKEFKYLIKTTCNSKTFNWIKSHKKK